MGGNAWDEGSALALDGAGNIYTTGRFAGTADFDPGPGVLHLTSPNRDAFVSKLDRTGNAVWAVAIVGAAVVEGRGVAVDASANVYVAGWFEGTADFDPGPAAFDLTAVGNQDVFVLKLDSAGNFVWAVAFGGDNRDARWRDEAWGIAVSNSGDVYTTGTFAATADFDPGPGEFNLSSAGRKDGFVSKLDVDGNLVWAVRMGSTRGDEARSVAVDSMGNAYATGFFEGTADFDPGPGVSNLISAGGEDVFVLKLDSAGSLSWAAGIGGFHDDLGLAIAVDESGNVHTTGSFSGPLDLDPGPGVAMLNSAGNNDIFVSKLSGTGSYLWGVSMGGTESERGWGVAVDGSGSVYTTGGFHGTADFDPGPEEAELTSPFGSGDVFVSKLDRTGRFAWAARFGDGWSDQGQGIAVDPLRSVYTTGGFGGRVDFDPGPGVFNLVLSGGGRDVFVSRLGVTCEGVAPTITGTAGVDQLVGTPGRDVIFGLAGDDVIDGRGGSDIICAGIGDDVIVGGPGDDTIFGNAGSDTVDYRNAPAAVDVDLAARTATGGHGTDSIRQVRNIVGSVFGDTLFGNSFDNEIEGRKGNDIMMGRGGNDHLLGGEGDDTLNGRGGDDRLHGGPGTDLATYIHAWGAVTVDLGIRTTQDTGDGLDTLTSIEDLSGSRHDDTLEGNAHANTIKGHRGDDLILGRAGDDTLRGNQGNDTADGGSGTDTCRTEFKIACE